MATSNLKIYRTKLTPARNALVDNLTGYLDSLTPTYSKSDFQYLKLDKDISIKVNLDQAYVLTSIGNYATITQDNKTWYYFIMDSNWISSSCVELFLSIDSINTFRNDLTMNAKTKIIRQHTEQFGLANNGAATFHPVQDRQMELNKEFYFGAGGTAMSIWDEMRRDDNSITFRRYDRGREQSLYGTLLEDTKVAQITFNMDKDRIEVYKKVNGALQLYKRIEYYDYPIVEPHTMEEDAICGTWSFSVSNWPEGGADIMEYYVEGEVTPPSPPTYYYKINPYSEGLGAPQIKYKEHDTSFISQDERDWYLIYKSNSTTAVSTTTAVKCCCVASEPIIFSPTGGGASQITIYNHSLVPGRFEYVLKSDNPNGAFRAECVVSYGSTVIKEYRDFKIGGEVCILAERQSSTTGAVTGWQERIFKIKNLRFWYPTSPADAQINMTAELELVDIGETYGSGSTGRINFDGFVLGISNIDTPTTFTFKVPNLQVKALNFTRLTTDSNITFQDAEDIASIKWYRIGDVQPTKVKGFNDIDRTNPALVKIIKLPYSPFTLTDIGNGVYILPSEWITELDDSTAESGYVLRLSDDTLSSELENFLGAITGDDLPLFWKADAVWGISPENIRSYTRESKLLHSEITSFKIVYDSFVKTLDLERFSFASFNPNRNLFRPSDLKIPVTFKPANTINSYMLFKFDTGATKSAMVTYLEKEDFENYMIVNRNNEESIFNNEYLNYVNNGYNYDKKARRLDVISDVIGIVSGVGAGLFSSRGASTITTTTDFIQDTNSWRKMTPAQSLNYFKNKTNGIGAVTQSTAKTASLISGAASFSFLSNALSGITSLIGKQVSWQNNMDAKLSNLKLQGTSVSGADDVNLMSYYCNNKLKIFTYRPREEDLKILSDLFFYCGYNNPTTERPRLNTRYWFNFIQCEPTFTQEGNSVYNDFIEDVKARYEAGVTVYHYHENYAENGWDWEQQYQNWDSWMIP